MSENTLPAHTEAQEGSGSEPNGHTVLQGFRGRLPPLSLLNPWVDLFLRCSSFT